VPVLYAHKAILSRIPYFDALFSNKFRETIHDATEEAALVASPGTGSYVTVNVDSLIADGIVDVDSIVQLVGYAYTGELVDPRTLRIDLLKHPGTVGLQNSVPDAGHQSSLSFSCYGNNDSHTSDPDHQDDDDLEYEADAIGLLIAANRMDFSPLALQAEKMVSLALSGDPSRAAEVLEFAEVYGFPRLAMQCQELQAFA
jgi:hypothetical protein